MLRQDLKPFRPTKEEMKESYIQEMYRLIIKKPNDSVYNFALNKLLSIFLYMFSEKEKKSEHSVWMHISLPACVCRVLPQSPQLFVF